MKIMTIHKITTIIIQTIELDLPLQLRLLSVRSYPSLQRLHTILLFWIEWQLAQPAINDEKVTQLLPSNDST
jgi:hypothetical protein